MIVRFFTGEHGGSGSSVHGVLEVPGGGSTPFCGMDELMTSLTRLAPEKRAPIGEDRASSAAP